MEKGGHSCGCGHEHVKISASARWTVTLAVVCAGAVFLRPLVARKIILRGDGYLNYGMLGEAVRQYRKALLLDPREDRARNWLGYALHKSGKIKEAIEIYERAVEKNPENVVAWQYTAQWRDTTPEELTPGLYFDAS